MTHFHTSKLDDGREVDIEYKVNAWGSPPQTYGPPESCHDGDPMEIEIELVQLSEEPVPGTITLIAPSDSEYERFENEIYENAPEYDTYDDYD